MTTLGMQYLTEQNVIIIGALTPAAWKVDNNNY